MPILTWGYTNRITTYIELVHLFWDSWVAKTLIFVISSLSIRSQVNTPCEVISKDVVVGRSVLFLDLTTLGSLVLNKCFNTGTLI